MSEQVAELVKSVMALNDEEKSEVCLEVIGGSTVKWLANFVKAMEEKFGVSAAAPMFAAPAASAGGDAAAEKEEKTSFDVVLTEAGANKIQVIKVVRAIVDGLGLKEAKELVDGAPKPVKTGLTKEEADKIKGELEAVGAKVELK